MLTTPTPPDITNNTYMWGVGDITNSGTTLYLTLYLFVMELFGRVLSITVIV